LNNNNLSDLIFSDHKLVTNNDRLN